MTTMSQMRTWTINNHCENEHAPVPQTVYVQLSDGSVLSVEFYEREPGCLTIASTSGRLSIVPSAANSIRIGVKLL